MFITLLITIFFLAILKCRSENLPPKAIAYTSVTENQTVKWPSRAASVLIATSCSQTFTIEKCSKTVCVMLAMVSWGASCRWSQRPHRGRCIAVSTLSLLSWLSAPMLWCIGVKHESAGILNEDYIYRCHHWTHDAVASSFPQSTPLKTLCWFTRPLASFLVPSNRIAYHSLQICDFIIFMSGVRNKLPWSTVLQSVSSLFCESHGVLDSR